MGLVVLMSASGSPGVTTTALGLAIGWPRPALLVEADPTGGSAIAARYLRGNLVPAETITDLALAERAGALSSALTRVTHPLPGTATTWLPSARSHTRPEPSPGCGNRSPLPSTPSPTPLGGPACSIPSTHR